MTDLTKSLQKLADLGAPLTVERTPVEDESDEYLIEIWLYVKPGNPLYQAEFRYWEDDGPYVVNVWTLTGWLEWQLEVRGYHLNYSWYPNEGESVYLPSLYHLPAYPDPVWPETHARYTDKLQMHIAALTFVLSEEGEK